MSHVAVLTRLDVCASELDGPLHSDIAVPAGFPSPAEGYFEGRIDLNKHLIIL